MGTFKVDGDISFTGAITTPGNDTIVIKPAKNNYDQIGGSDCKFWKIYATTFYGALSGNASTATKLATARTISLTGSVTGSGTFDGSGNLSIATTTNHSHSYIPLTGGFTSVSSGETDLGIAYGSNKYLYLWGKPGDGSRGLYDTNKGSVITVTDSGATFYGTASYASSAGNCDTVDGWHADGFLQKHGWWKSGDTHSVNDLASGIVFSYINHGAPASWGHTVAFTNGANNAYGFQLHATGTNRLFMRNKSSDYGQSDWVEILTSSNALLLSGGTMTGALNFANGTWNNLGDDVRFGDQNVAGSFVIEGLNGNTTLQFNQYGSSSVKGTISLYGNDFHFSTWCHIPTIVTSAYGSSFPTAYHAGQIFFKT